MKVRALLALFAAIGGGQAFANEESAWYVQAELGKATSKVSSSDIDGLFNQQNIQASNANLDDDDFAWALHLGYELTEYVAVELGYMDLGERSLDIVGNTTDLEGFYQQVSKVYPEAGEGVSAALALTMPITEEDLSVTARLGYFDWRGDYRTRNIAQVVGSDRPEGEDIWYGISGNYQLDESWSVSLNYKRVKLENHDNDVYTLGVNYHY